MRVFFLFNIAAAAYSGVIKAYVTKDCSGPIAGAALLGDAFISLFGAVLENPVAVCKDVIEVFGATCKASDDGSSTIASCISSQATVPAALQSVLGSSSGYAAIELFSEKNCSTSIVVSAIVPNVCWKNGTVSYKVAKSSNGDVAYSAYSSADCSGASVTTRSFTIPSSYLSASTCSDISSLVNSLGNNPANSITGSSNAAFGRAYYSSAVGNFDQKSIGLLVLSTLFALLSL